MDAVTSPSPLDYYECYICRTPQYQSRTECIAHLRLHACITTVNTAKLFPCRICPKAYAVHDNLRKHLLVHCNETKLKCTFCPKSFAFKTHYDAHMKYHYKPQNPLHCTKCDRTFTKKAVLNHHLRVHNGIKLHRCEPCNKSYYTKSSLKEHLLGHNNSRLFKCEICSRGFNNRSTLRDHRAIHSDKRYTCEECNVSYRRTEGYKKHLKRVHSLDLPHKCRFCIARFERMTDLKAHQAQLHDSDRPFNCHVCQKKFHRNDHLKSHMRLHTGDQPYHCPICDMNFRHGNTLKNHMRSHTGEKPFVCQKCNKSFRDKGDLVKHDAAHITVRRFHCDTCQKSFKTQAVLKNHRDTHRTDQQFNCEHCSKVFTQRRYYTEHKKKFHPPAISIGKENVPVRSPLKYISTSGEILKIRKKYERQPPAVKPTKLIEKSKNAKENSILKFKNSVPNVPTPKRQTTHYTLRANPRVSNKLLAQTEGIANEYASGKETIQPIKKSASKALKVEAPDELLHCSICDIQFWNEHYLQLHRKQHNTPRCTYCNATFTYMKSYKVHMKMHAE